MNGPAIVVDKNRSEHCLGVQSEGKYDTFITALFWWSLAVLLRLHSLVMFRSRYICVYASVKVH